MDQSPDHLLFSQHGWADTNRAMLALGQALAAPRDVVIAPDLGYVQTWLSIESLAEAVERAAVAALELYPAASVRIVGHSMGGLLWLEVLHRHPEWWPRVDRLVLLGSPVGGAEAAALLAPLGVGVATGLVRSRQDLAEVVAAGVPTLSITGDILPGSDGTISHRSAQVKGVRYVAVPNVSHVTLRTNRLVQRLIRAFFRRANPPDPPLGRLIQQLRTLPGVQPVDPRLGRLAPVWMMFEQGSTVRYWPQLPGLDLVFVAEANGYCCYGALVSWEHRPALRGLLGRWRDEYANQLV